MTIHPLASQVLKGDILPYVIHVHSLNIPYQAELWIGGEPKYRDGVASLHISENGYLIAEYVAYDASSPLDDLGLVLFGENDCKVIILNTQVEIPVDSISTSRTKARTLYSTTVVPRVVVYEGRVTGWLGNSSNEVESVTMLMTDFPNLGMPSLTHSVPDRLIGGNLSLLGKDAGCKIDVEQVEAVIKKGAYFRNTIDHGSAGRIEDEELNHVIALQLYLHNLARLLILAKLGLRDRHTRGEFYTPKFVEI